MLDDAQHAFGRHQVELMHASMVEVRELDAMQNALQELQFRVAEEHACASGQKKNAAQRETEMIANVEARVKRTLLTKDKQLGELQMRCVASENKVRELEYLLARQREELLNGITNDFV